MKKILAIALALVLVLSMGMVALADDPAVGTQENPINVYSVMDIKSTWATVPAGTTLWYNFDSMTFDGKTLSVSMGTLTKVTVDGTEFFTTPMLRGGIEATLTARAPSMLVGLVNDSEYDQDVLLDIVVPEGIESNPKWVYEGNNTVEPSLDVLNETMGLYFTALEVSWGGGFDLTAFSTVDGADDAFNVHVKYVDADENTQQLSLTPDENGAISGHVDAISGTTAVFVIELTGWDIPVIDMTIEGPEIGSADRPQAIWSTYDFEYLTVPANSTLYVTLYDFLSSCVGVYVDKELITATVDGEEIAFIEGGENAPYSVTLALTNDSDAEVVAPLWAEYPAGTQENPDYLGNGETKLNATGNSYHYVYTALNDGKLTVKVDSIDTIVGLSLENTIVRDPDYDGSNYEKYFDYMGNHADKDAEGNTVYDDETHLPVYSSPSQYYATIEVSKGDEIVIAIEGKTDDEDNLIPMDVTLTVDGPQAPVGHYENMDKFEVGKNSFTISGEDVLYCGTWTAPANGTITVTLVGDVYEFAMGEMETEDPVILSETDKLVLKVKKGEQIAFMAVAGMDENTGEFVDTDVELTLDFVEDKEDSPATGATGATAAVLLTLVSAAGLAVLSKKRNA